MDLEVTIPLPGQSVKITTNQVIMLTLVPGGSFLIHRFDSVFNRLERPYADTSGLDAWIDSNRRRSK